MDKLLDAARRLSLVKRYATMRVVSPQDVAQHSFNATVIAYKLIKEAGGEEAFEILAATLFHDIHEGIIGDLIYPLKYRNDRIRAEVAEIEAEVNFSLGVAAPYFNIVKAADIAEALLYLREEIELGNQNGEIHRMFSYALKSTAEWAELLQSKFLIELVANCECVDEKS
jgi:5'-deoxynucleotidase YfbR-like HD superfamily hydrolase